MKPRQFFSLALFLFSATHTLAAETNRHEDTKTTESGKQTLQNMVHAMQSLSYQGTVAFLRNGKLEPMKYFHAANNGLEQERLLSLNSPLREIIRDTGRVSCLFKETQQRIEENRPFDRSFLVDLPKNINELDNTYSISIVGEEEIAMLPAYVVALEAKDSWRYSRTIWIEKEHFLPLKAIVYDFSNEILEQMVFTELSLNNALAFVKNNPTGNSPNQPSTQSLSEASFLITAMPPGYRELFFTRKPMHNTTQPVDHLLISDGLSWISVYMEQNISNVQNEPKPMPTVGAINFYSRPIGNFEFTVMGDAPPETVKLIAENIKLPKNK